MPNTKCTGGQDSSRVPWHIILDATAPTKALLSINGYQIVIVEVGAVGTRMRNLLFSHVAEVTQNQRELKFLHKETMKWGLSIPCQQLKQNTVDFKAKY